MAPRKTRKPPKNMRKGGQAGSASTSGGGAYASFARAGVDENAGVQTARPYLRGEVEIQAAREYSAAVQEFQYQDALLRRVENQALQRTRAGFEQYQRLEGERNKLLEQRNAAAQNLRAVTEKTRNALRSNSSLNIVLQEVSRGAQFKVSDRFSAGDVPNKFKDYLARSQR